MPRLGRTDADGLVGEADGSESRSASLKATTAGQAEVATGAQDADGDLAAIGDQDLRDGHQAVHPLADELDRAVERCGVA